MFLETLFDYAVLIYDYL